MTWKEKRIVTALCTVICILLAALLIVFSIRYRQNRQAQAEAEANVNLPVVGETVEEGAFVGLRLKTDSASLTFSMDQNGRWIWADTPDFPLNDETVLAILELLESPKPQQTLPAEGGPEAYGLSSPAASVTATRTDGTEMTVLLGKATTDGKSRYAMFNGDEATVYILDGGLYDLLHTPVYQMMQLPQLPELTEEALLSVTVLGPLKDDGTALTVELTAQPQEDGSVRWSDGSADVTDSKLTAALVDDVLHLALTRCIDYAPSEGAVEICGLNDPAAVLTVRYASGDAEQELQLAVGGRLTDGSGRYLRISGDDTIYFLPTELLDPLMHIAAHGLN